ncbi:MAG TPA: hypothetical protein VFP49_01680 [Nitrososphaeraceae archaeon]|nr:hypothetical protein [Nitrososphaeraceae archaeon]
MQEEKEYSISVSNIQGYKISQQNQCKGQIISGEVKTCLITLDDEAKTQPPPSPLPPQIK